MHRPSWAFRDCIHQAVNIKYGTVTKRTWVCSWYGLRWTVAHALADGWHAECENGANEPQYYRVEEHRGLVRLALLCVRARVSVLQIRLGMKARQDAINGVNEKGRTR
jgi:hypothetical protein